MLLTSQIKIKIHNRIKKYYNLLNYDTNLEFITVDIKDIPINSQYNVDCLCDDCGKKLKMTYQKYNKRMQKTKKIYCKKCINKYIINPFSKNEIKEKIKDTMLKKYGVENPLQNKKIKEKQKNTMIEKYGVENALCNIDIKNKMVEKINNKTKEEKKEIIDKWRKSINIDNNMKKLKSSMIEKYGVENALCNIDIKNKMVEKINNKTKEEKKEILQKYINTNLQKYGVKYPSMLSQFKEKSKTTKRLNSIEKFKNKHKDINIFEINYDKETLICECEKHGKYSIRLGTFYHRNRENHNMCIFCNSLGSYIKIENDIFNFIQENYFNEIKTHERKLLSDKLELDIYLPDLKLAFEFNGLYWHSEIYKDNNYHLNKTEMCEQQGIHLIHIYEDDWLFKQEIIKSRILNLLGKTPNKIYARKCVIKEISDNKLIRDFFEKNHLQGFVGSQIKIGLFHQDELISLMIFGSRRISMGSKSKNDIYEMLRFCSKLNTSVIGGSSKLFKYFIEKYNPVEVISYADRSWSSGNLYKNLGFTLVHKTQPNYYYIIDRKRHHRFNFRKDKLVRDGFDSTKTEHEIMLERKIYKIYDSGSYFFLYVLSL